MLPCPLPGRRCGCCSVSGWAGGDVGAAVSLAGLEAMWVLRCLLPVSQNCDIKGQGAVTVLGWRRHGWFLCGFPVNLLVLLQTAAFPSPCALQISRCPWASSTPERTRRSSTQWSSCGILPRGRLCLSRCPLQRLRGDKSVFQGGNALFNLELWKSHQTLPGDRDVTQPSSRLGQRRRVQAQAPLATDPVVYTGLWWLGSCRPRGSGLHLA